MLISYPVTICDSPVLIDLFSIKKILLFYPWTSGVKRMRSCSRIALYCFSFVKDMDTRQFHKSCLYNKLFLLFIRVEFRKNHMDSLKVSSRVTKATTITKGILIFRNCTTCKKINKWKKAHTWDFLQSLTASSPVYIS